MAGSKSETTWRMSISLNAEIDFCVSVLLTDGLRADPFDSHPEGSLILQSAGMNERSWRAWMRQVVAEQRTKTRALEADPHETANWKKWQSALDLWTGDAAVAWALGGLWETFKESSDASREASAEKVDDLMAGKNLRRALKPYQARLFSLRAYAVHYPKPVVVTYKPDTTVVGLGKFDPWDFERQLLEAAETLSTA